jgi:MFS family permease
MPKRDRLVFITLFFSIFATITGVGIVVPLLPVYARNLGAGGVYIGLIFGAFSLSRIFFLPYFGRLSDEKGRKSLIVPGLLAYTIVSIAFLACNTIGSLILVRLVQGIASAMLMPVIQAYVGDITPTGREGFTMGLFNMSIFFGLSLGPVLGGLMHDRFSLDAAFVAMGALSLVGFFLSLLLLPPVHSERVIRRERRPAALKQLARNPNVTGLFAFRFAYTACIGIIWGFLPVLASVELTLSSTTIGFLVMLGIFISGAIQLPMGYLADRLSREGMVIVGGLMVSGAVLFFAWADRVQELVWASIVFGVGGGICMPAIMATAVVIGDATAAMGSVMALLTVAHSAGILAGSMLAGVMMDLFKLRAVFPFGALLMLLGIAAFFTAGRIRHPRPADKPPHKLP